MANHSDLLGGNVTVPSCDYQIADFNVNLTCEQKRLITNFTLEGKECLINYWTDPKITGRPNVRG